MPEQKQEYDLIIVGAGPAGSAAALYAGRMGLKTLLLEKEKFPRDKICGDAISGKSMDILKDLGLFEKALQLPSARVHSVTFGSPDLTTVNIPFRPSQQSNQPTGLVIRRTVFDQFLFSEACTVTEAVREEFEVTEILTEKDAVVGVKGINRGTQKEETFRGKIIIGADGFNSLVSRAMGLYKHEAEHWVVALRQYYRGVGGLDKQIELHFIDEVIPGYFWIFPADDHKANVGIGMLHASMKKYNIDLRKALQAAVNSSQFRERFAGAEALEEPRGWNLPVGSTHRRNYGNGFLLLGDAAGLIDPFTGEGIGNALFSAKIAARTAAEAIKTGDVSANALARYDRELWNVLGPELSLSSKLQKLGRHRTLLNLVVRKAARNPHVRELISGMMADEVPKNRLANPMFYVKLLFN